MSKKLRLCQNCQRSFVDECDVGMCPACEDAEREAGVPGRAAHEKALELANFYIARDTPAPGEHGEVSTIYARNGLLARCYKQNREQLEDLRAQLQAATLGADPDFAQSCADGIVETIRKINAQGYRAEISLYGDGRYELIEPNDIEAVGSVIKLSLERQVHFFSPTQLVLVVRARVEGGDVASLPGLLDPSTKGER